MQRIQSVGVLSVAKVAGLCYGAMGILFVPIFLVFVAVGSIASKQAGNPGFPPIFGVVFALCAPIFYGVMGFVVGAIGAFVYNLISGWIGGIEVELQPVTAQPIPVAPQNL